MTISDDNSKFSNELAETVAVQAESLDRSNDLPAASEGESSSLDKKRAKSILVIKYLVAAVCIFGFVVYPIIKEQLSNRKPKKSIAGSELNSLLINIDSDKEIEFGEGASISLPNPEMSWFERNFCRGYQKVPFFCNEDPKHPLFEYIKDSRGDDYDRWAKEQTKKLSRKKAPWHNKRACQSKIPKESIISV